MYYNTEIENKNIGNVCLQYKPFQFIKFTDDYFYNKELQKRNK